MRKIIYASILFTIFSSGCKVAEKEFRKGNYDEAIDICVKKLIDNPDKSEYSLILEEAFRRANEEDLSMIKVLNTEGRPDRWEEIYHIYESVYTRQEKIKPLLPIFIGEEERDAEFVFVNAVDGLNTAKKNAAAYWYADATQKMETKDIYKAREAYYELQKINNFYAEYKDVDDLINKARTLGTSDVLFTIKNVSNTTLSSDIVRSINEIEVEDAFGSWYIIHDNLPDEEIDYTVRVNIRSIISYPEKVTNNTYVESKEIQDGYEFVYDDNGDLVKDSLGNPIKVPDYKTVSATVHETWQEKIATISGEVQYIDKTGRIIKTISIKSDALFQNYYATASGYYEALSQESKAKIGGKPMPFPTDNTLLIEAVRLLGCDVNDVMDDYNEEYLNL
ncbi:MAG: hypothetical protein ACHQFW_04165 [Chitinophagales bacterium]